MRGFSLIELSIVLVILGLLTGGILAGQSLIRAAELRAVASEYERYMAAANSFRSKYMALPGDMNNATLFWGYQSSTSCARQSSAPSNSTGGACDGNGDGSLGTGAGPGLSGEMFQFWRQLALAGMIEGHYTGQQGPDASSLSMVIGTNIPASKLTNAGWGIRALKQAAGHANTFAVDYGNYLQFGAQKTDDNYAAALKPEEAWNIDIKLDDGKPATGKIIARLWATCTDADDGVDYASSYLLTSASIACVLMFPNAL